MEVESTNTQNFKTLLEAKQLLYLSGKEIKYVESSLNFSLFVNRMNLNADLYQIFFNFLARNFLRK